MLGLVEGVVPFYYLADLGEVFWILIWRKRQFGHIMPFYFHLGRIEILGVNDQSDKCQTYKDDNNCYYSTDEF